MKATDLRLGNLVWNNVQNIPVEVDMKILSDCLLFEKGHKQFEWHPIPLTEEMLLKCGARRIDKYTFVLKGLFIHLRKIGFVFNVGKKKIIIEHLHTLQNLTFALTGEELKLKA